MQTILSIDTSCDETSVAVTKGRKVISHIEYSQILLHKKWGGIVPSLARWAHKEKIGMVIEESLRRAARYGIGWDDISAVAVTCGPGLAIALEVGIEWAKKLAREKRKKLIAVNHLEGHLYSVFAQNSQGKPERESKFPYLGLIVSGGHTELVIFKKDLEYEIIGSTLDDAVGEALDKAAKMLGLGYPGGPVIERLAKEINNLDLYKFPRPMWKNQSLNFSFSGLKTSFLYFLRNLSEKEKMNKINYLASSFQEAAFDSILKKVKQAFKIYSLNRIVVGGGVSANMRLRLKLRKLAREISGEVIFPPYKYLCQDNAAMIGVVADLYYRRRWFVKDFSILERVPRAKIDKRYY